MDAEKYKFVTASSLNNLLCTMSVELTFGKSRAGGGTIAFETFESVDFVTFEENLTLEHYYYWGLSLSRNFDFLVL